MTEAFDRLYPALIQAFVIIGAGYGAGRLGTLTGMQAQGISSFVTHFALPALLFRNMCSLDFSNVSWLFLLSIFVAKTAVFALVGVVTGLATRPTNWGKVGLYGMFATQSNDFALCYPIVVAIYSETHPEFVKYLYLIAPISLIFLNPLGFTLLELHKWQNTPPDQRTSKLKAVLTVVKGVVLNPIVFMSALGICGNFIFRQHVPRVIDSILQVLGDSFAATALFYLGVSMVGKIQRLQAKSLVAPALLICAKMLLLPFLAREITVRFLDTTHTGTNVTNDLTNYAFLYGTIPTAPPVYLYATHYGVAMETVGAGLVAGTFLSGPVMFVSAKMVMMSNMVKTGYETLIKGTALNAGILTIIGTVWVLGVLFLSRRHRSIPHRFALSLTLAQLLIGVSTVMWYFAPSMPPWVFYIYFVLFHVGVVASRCWVAMVAVGVSVLRVHSLCYLLKIRACLYFYGFGMPVLLTGVLLLVTRYTGDTDVIPSFAYGNHQLIMSVCVICLNIIITVSAVIALQRRDTTFLSVRSRTTSTNEGNLEEQPANQISHPADTTSSQANQNPVMSSGTNQIPCPSGSTGASAMPDWEPPGTSSQTHVQGGSSLPASFGARGRKRRTIRRKPLPVKKTCAECDGEGDCEAPVITSIEDIVPFPSQSDMSTPQVDSSDTAPLVPRELGREQCLPLRAGRRCSEQEIRGCSTLVESYQSAQLDALDEEEIAVALGRSKFQITKHLVLVLVLLVAALISLFIHLWKLFMENMGGLYIEIEFLDCVLTYGQGVITFAVFGLDTEMVLSPFIRKVRWLVWGRQIRLTPWEELDSSTQQTCQQFVFYHKDSCQKDIVGCRRYMLRSYRKVFTGTDLVDWLVDNRLVADRERAVTFGKSLLEGRVIEHVNRERHFCDLPYIYHFVDEGPDDEAPSI